MRNTRIIVPCYNEATRLNPETFLCALKTEPNLSFLFVDDGSTDDTLKIIKTIKEKNLSQVEVLNLEFNSGKAEAVRRGMQMALEGQFENVGYWDADLATPLDAITSLSHMLEDVEVDIVIGSRVCLLGRRIKRRAIRHYLGRIFATFASLLLGITIYDTQCGAKIFKNTDILRQVFEKPFKVNWTFDVELLARLLILNGTSPVESSTRWAEFPLDEWIDVKGSKIKAMTYLQIGIEIATLYYYLRTPALRFYKEFLTKR
ncbi:MAG: glycosyltransferase [Pelobacteraceae bacterium]